MMLRELIETPERVMGVKAVFGLPYLNMTCFSDEGSARRVAERAIREPYIVVIASGSAREKFNVGRVLGILRATGVYGRTENFVGPNAHSEAVLRWPFGVVISETYRVVGDPHVQTDLNMTGDHILKSQRVGVSKSRDRSSRIWHALQHFQVELRTEIAPPKGLVEPKAPLFLTATLPIDPGSLEGEEKRTFIKDRERDKYLRARKLADFREKNDNRLYCEGCDFTDDEDGMFDIHHLNPMARGERRTFLNELSVLCPTCHRFVHRRASNWLHPLSMAELRQHRHLTIDVK